jgi:phosphate starvation-inducible protein PhoH
MLVSLSKVSKPYISAMMRKNLGGDASKTLKSSKSSKSSNAHSASNARKFSTSSYDVAQIKKPKAKKPLTYNQQRYCEFLEDPTVPIVIGIGKAGSGKTLLASSKAIDAFYNKQVSKILITRPAVNLDEDHGFLPGKLEDKMRPWLQPIFSYFLEYYTSDSLNALVKEELIEICPLAYIRGRTFDNAFIIADEMQNTTPNQMKTFLTRIGHDTKVAITGDLEQCDLTDTNGLRQFLDQMVLYNRISSSRNEEGAMSSIKVVEFTEDDVQRSEVVKKVLSIYSASPVDAMFIR